MRPSAEERKRKIKLAKGWKNRRDLAPIKKVSLVH